jgi:hypothetical protein
MGAQERAVGNSTLSRLHYGIKYVSGLVNPMWRPKSPAPVFVEWECCADEKTSARIADRARIKTIRSQSAILYKNPTLSLLLTETLFLVRMLFIRTKNKVGARRAQDRPWYATTSLPPYT